jgi:phosphatidylglycerol:prolipoprotein diacylglycerol transferase
MLPTLHIGPLALQTAGLILLLGLWLGLEWADRQTRTHPQLAGRIFDLALVSLLAGVVSARLGYAAQYPAAFFKSPLGLLALTPQMLDPLIGVIVGLLALLIHLQRHHLPVAAALDALTTTLAVLAVAIGLANLASGDVVGAPSHLPWAILWDGAWRHPTALYQILAAVLILVAVWPVDWNPLGRAFRHPGARFWFFLALSALAALLIEASRADSSLIFGTLRQLQVIAWLALALSLWQLRRVLYSTG